MTRQDPRAAALAEAADHIVRHCPDHGTEDEARMDCACDLADEIRELQPATRLFGALPAWEATYEPGNVSDYLIGYANDVAAAKGAAEAWFRSQSEMPGELAWEEQPINLPGAGCDVWLECHRTDEDGVTDTGMVIRHRKTNPTTTEE